MSWSSRRLTGESCFSKLSRFCLVPFWVLSQMCIVSTDMGLCCHWMHLAKSTDTAFKFLFLKRETEELCHSIPIIRSAELMTHWAEGHHILRDLPRNTLATLISHFWSVWKKPEFYPAVEILRTLRLSLYSVQLQQKNVVVMWWGGIRLMFKISFSPGLSHVLNP